MDFRWGEYAKAQRQSVESVYDNVMELDLELKRSRDQIINGFVYYGN